MPTRLLRPRRDDRGAVFPSPVVVLSIIAVAMAAIAFFATRGTAPTEREVTPAAEAPSPSATTSTAPEKEQKPAKPVVKRGETYVVVFNNSGIPGLAGRVATTVTGAGWKVAGSDNWYGTIPANTVYYPPRLKRAADLLALDLGIERTALAVDPMELDRLTVILTDDL